MQDSAAFVVPHGIESVTEEHVARLDQFKNDDLNGLLVGSEASPGWLRAYRSRQGQAWKDTIERLTGQMWQALVQPIWARLQHWEVDRIILMPAGGLQLLPLHAAWRMVDGGKRYLMDDYEVSYAPSAFGLKTAQTRASSHRGQAALVAGVSEYRRLSRLIFTRAEVEEVGQLLNTQPLVDAMATANAVRERAAGAVYVHLSCHGSFAWGQDALASALYLADDEPLTLADVIGRMDLSAARLVTLSACETGISDVRQSPDEYVGLPAGFLQAGAAGVVSSLWSVNDLSTALLMIKFYQAHIAGSLLPPAAALRQAQFWLRDVSNAELSELFAVYKQNAPDGPAQSRMVYELARKEFRKHTLRQPDERPFAHPYYWAPFAFYGA